jgi:hypothetical protein
MDKKKYFLLAILIVAAIVVILIFSSKQNTQVTNPETVKQVDQIIPGGQPIVEEPLIAEENILTVSNGDFSPKTLTSQANAKVFLTFSATDKDRHLFGFTESAITKDASLAPVVVVFSQEEGEKSISFPAPIAGEYSFYVDDEANSIGTLIIK